MKEKATQLTRIIIFSLIIIACLCSIINSSVALLLGFLYANLFGNQFLAFNNKVISFLLKLAIIGIGFNLDIQETWGIGQNGFIYTMIFVAFALCIGILLGKTFKVEQKTAHLISSGTAICGGSAIAAIASTINAPKEDISIALSIVFILNAIALLVFPTLGHIFNLSEYQFGLWSAIAIHDTSSVVGAAQIYGEEALKIATVIKLVKTLWIIPVAIFSSLLFKGEFDSKKIPWFIAIFALVIIINSYWSISSTITNSVYTISKSIFVVVLFLIGTNLSISKIKAVGWKPAVLGISTWFIISTISLIIILNL
ncbi:YeiH family protein [Aquimarina macrocephali]|uniref:YeiH family protein n=1 Tax=Aquimarina macrocephali TaxID=666563 RepID=UPI0004630CB3|nr:putative sulfate exporter family transporter [Aquimarina macrocephali]